MLLSVEFIHFVLPLNGCQKELTPRTSVTGIPILGECYPLVECVRVFACLRASQISICNGNNAIYYSPNLITQALV